jgi:hypothetical protein
VADQTDALADEPSPTPGRDQRLKVLRLRSYAMDFAVVLAALAGVQTCGAILVLFLGEVLGKGAATLLFLMFGGAIVLTMGALAAYVVEMLLAAQVIRLIVARNITAPGPNSPG